MEQRINDQQNNLQEKVCLVTGATAGIGKVTATALAAQGAEVIIAGRNKQKTEAVVEEIRAKTGNDSLHYLLADYADLEQVRAMAKEFKERYDRLDVLVNNAGAFFNKRESTPYGVEMTFLINHLAPFLLTNLLLETIINIPPARIVNVSSEAHRQDKMDFDDLGFEQSYSGIRAYARSKLANILFTYELSRRLTENRITVNALHPGHVATDIWKTSFPKIGAILMRVLGFIALTPEQGADNSIYLASSPEVAGVTGKYFVKHNPVDSSLISRDRKVAQRLWEISESLTS